MNNQLTRGLKYLYETEQNCYLMDMGIKALDRKISSLGNRKNYREPERQAYNGNGMGAFITILSIGAIIGAVVGGIYGLFIYDTYLLLRPVTCIGGVIFGVLDFGGVSAIIGLIVGVIVRCSVKKSIEKKYEADLEQFDEIIARDAQRTESEIRQKNILISQRKTLCEKSAETYRNLNEYYRMMGIDHTYQGIVIIYYMYEYARLGICDSLEGPFGLYKIIDEKMDREIIKSVLDDISHKLDLLAENQKELYDELKRVNSQCEAIVSSMVKQSEILAKNNTMLEKAVENTEISAYYSKLSYNQQVYRDFFLCY